MNDAEYILLKRKKRLWPAKVLSRVCAPQTRQASKDVATHCLVEILGLNKQACVCCKDAELLTEESINGIAAELGMDRFRAVALPREHPACAADGDLVSTEVHKGLSLCVPFAHCNDPTPCRWASHSFSVCVPGLGFQGGRLGDSDPPHLYIWVCFLVGQTGKGHDNMEEIRYRRTLREALDILQEATPSKTGSPSKSTRSRASAWEATKEPAAGRWPPSSRSDAQKREGEAGEAPAALQPAGTRKKRSCRSKGKAEGSSSANSPRSKSRVLLRNGELKGQPRRASQAKTPGTSKKDVTPKPSPGRGPSRRSPRFSSGCERRHPDEAGRDRRPPSSPSKCFARTSTPARSSHNRAESTPGRRPGGKLGLRRSLLGSPVKRPSAEAETALSEKNELPPRKYSKDLDGERHPRGSEGAAPKQIPALSWERRSESHPEASVGSLDPAGPVSDGIREESLRPRAEEAKNFQCCDLEGKGLGSPSEQALRPIGELGLSSVFGDEEEVEDEEELPSILLHQEPCAMEAGMLVWCKAQRYPYWPAVVKSVKRKAKKASVQFIEKPMDEEKSKGFSISLKNLKHFDCPEKQTLIDKAKENYHDHISWCINLITDYRIRVGCHSFTGTLLEYCADDMSYPVRKESHHSLSQMTFPQIKEVDSEDPPPEATPPKPPRKVLPDRTRAARDRANKKIVEFIVKAKGADEHLSAILKGEKESRWLKRFHKALPYMTSIETYLEDDDQLDVVVRYLQIFANICRRNVYQKVVNGDKFVLDVLFPEAIIFAISAVDQIDYKKAEQKYIRGPLLSQREKEKFEEEILEKKRKQRLQRPTRSPEETS